MNFVKTFLAALLAFFVANIVLSFLVTMIFVSILMATTAGESTQIKKGTILNIDLSVGVTDAPRSSPFEGFDFVKMSTTQSNGLYDVVTAIDRAAQDENISGIFISNPDRLSMNTAQAEEIRNALVRFKEGGKFMLSYSEGYSKLGYYLASTAEVYLHPMGSVDWSGLSVTTWFYAGLLEKLNINVDVIRHGAFKSYTEPFTNKKMSPQSMAQIQSYADGVWGVLVDDIARSRGLDSAALWSYADDMDNLLFAQKALENKLVDELVCRDQVQDILTCYAGKQEYKDVKFITLSKYISASKANLGNRSQNKISVIYAEGNMVDGDGSMGEIGGRNLADKLEKARKDDKVKAVVLRVNTGGGSALAAEVIHREIMLLKELKPVVISMGSAAASGGYYIACAGDIILSQKTTVTGSIGVTAFIFSAEKGLRDKMGITTDTYRTNRSADLGGIHRPLNSYEISALTRSVEHTYKTFVNHVAEGRNMTYEQVDKIGGGQIWTGMAAQRIGLTDGYGGLTDAITLAVDRADIGEDYSLQHVTDNQNALSTLLAMGASMHSATIKNELGQFYQEYNTMSTLIEQNNCVMTRIPFEMEVK